MMILGQLFTRTWSRLRCRFIRVSFSISYWLAGSIVRLQWENNKILMSTLLHPHGFSISSLTTYFFLKIIEYSDVLSGYKHFSLFLIFVAIFKYVKEMRVIIFAHFAQISSYTCY